MTTLVFKANGACGLAVDDDLPESDFPDAAKVLYVPYPISANEVWYDFSHQAMLFRRPFDVGISPNTVTGLPVGTRAVVKGAEIVVDDGSLELDVDYPETVRVLLIHPSNLDTWVEVPCEVTG